VEPVSRPIASPCFELAEQTYWLQTVGLQPIASCEVVFSLLAEMRASKFLATVAQFISLRLFVSKLVSSSMMLSLHKLQSTSLSPSPFAQLLPVNKPTVDELLST
jgi:hypothetical protein